MYLNTVGNVDVLNNTKQMFIKKNVVSYCIFIKMFTNQQ